MPRKAKRKPSPRSPALVLQELRARAAAGRSIASGANRGDWLYATAVRFFGSWGKAVEAAGFSYEREREVGLSADEVLRRIRRAAEQGEVLKAGNFKVEASGARRHFGSWRAAVETAGCELPSRYTWTAERVLNEIRQDLRRGLSVRTLEVIGRNEALYGAARRRFGSWKSALAAAMQQHPAAVARPATRKRPKKAAFGSR